MQVRQGLQGADLVVACSQRRSVRFEEPGVLWPAACLNREYCVCFTPVVLPSTRCAPPVALLLSLTLSSLCLLQNLGGTSCTSPCVILFLFLDLHREELEALVSTLAHCIRDSERPLHVHGGSAKDPLLQNFDRDFLLGCRTWFLPAHFLSVHVVSVLPQEAKLLPMVSLSFFS